MKKLFCHNASKTAKTVHDGLCAAPFAPAQGGANIGVF